MRRGIILFSLLVLFGLTARPGTISAQEGLSSILIKLERMEARLEAIETAREGDSAILEERLAQVSRPTGQPDISSILDAVEPRFTDLEVQLQAQQEEGPDTAQSRALSELGQELQQLRLEIQAMAQALAATASVEETEAEDSNEPVGHTAENGNGHAGDNGNGHANGNGHEAEPASDGTEDEAADAPATEPAPAAPVLEAPEWKLSGFAHMQLNTSSAEEGLASGFRIRRARFTVSGSFNQYVSGKIQPDFGGGSFSLKDAYIKLSTYTGSTNLTMGQFKQPFDLFELTSDTKLEVIERSGSIDGVSGCPGVGGMCSYGRFTGKLGYAGRDVGVKVDGSLDDGRISYAASFTNGAGPNKAETNDTKAFAGRLTYKLANGIRISGNAAVRDYETETDPAHARAYGFDVEVGSLGKPGFHSQVAFSAGDNWKNLGDDGAPVGFTAAQALAGYRIPVTRYPGVLDSIEPVARVSWGDPSRELQGDAGMLYTPGVMIHLAGGNNIAANLDVWSPETGRTEWSFKIQTYLTIAGISSR